MKSIQFTVHQQRIAQDHTANVPDDIVSKGDKAIEEWLFINGRIDNALDYAEKNTKVFITPE